MRTSRSNAVAPPAFLPMRKRPVLEGYATHDAAALIQRAVEERELLLVAQDRKEASKTRNGRSGAGEEDAKACGSKSISSCRHSSSPGFIERLHHRSTGDARFLEKAKNLINLAMSQTCRMSPRRHSGRICVTSGALDRHPFAGATTSKLCAPVWKPAEGN